MTVRNTTGGTAFATSLIPSTTQIWASTAVWASSEGVINATLSGSMGISTALAGSANIVTTAGLRQTISTALASSANLVTNPQLFTPISTTLASSANLVVNSAQRWAISTNLANNGQLIANTSTRWSMPATLSGGASIVADLTLVAVVAYAASAQPNASSDIIAQMLVVPAVIAVVNLPGGSSNPPAPQRRRSKIKARKQVTVAKRPPEADIPPDPAPLPPVEIRQSRPLVPVRTKPAKTYDSPIVDEAPQLQHDIVRAHDESTDIEDAIMILKHLEII